jgi:4-diphosphocytidyl-2-C-methyl-D-erythritol kinase
LTKVDTDCVLFHIIIKPDISVSTADMYKRIDESPCETRKGRLYNTVAALKRNDIKLVKENQYNIFDDIISGHSDEIKMTKLLLSNAGASSAFLSGSGPSVFCVLKDEEEAMKILDRIPKEKSREVFLAATYKGGIYGNNGNASIS